MASETDNNTVSKLVRVNMDTRLNHRVLDLRVPAHRAVFLLQSAVTSLFRSSLAAQGFIEIHSPKLQGGVSEGGAAVFKLDYFGTSACLAQSPQLYKQMAVLGGLERVFEVGPVFRAEQSHTSRHLCEFVGLDFEMAIAEHYDEAMDVLEQVLVSTFDALNANHRADLSAVASQYPFTPVAYRPYKSNLRLSFAEAIALLAEDGATNEDGTPLDPTQDLSSALERRLGLIVAAKYNTDLFFVHGFPAEVRPFYTMPNPHDPRFSNAFDVYLRGQEICSGAQRVHDRALLDQRLQGTGVGASSLKSYCEAFSYGAVPHAGAGLGLERLVMLFLGLDNVRQCSLFPRDPKRLSP